MSMGPPLGARRSLTPAANTFPVAGQDRIFDIPFDATFIAAQAIHRALGLRESGRAEHECNADHDRQFPVQHWSTSNWVTKKRRQRTAFGSKQDRCHWETGAESRWLRPDCARAAHREWRLGASVREKPCVCTVI